MPVAFILDFAGGSLEQYDAVVGKMRLDGHLPPGALFHAAGSGSDGALRVVDVWKSDAAFGEFAEAKITPLSAEAGLAKPAIERFEVDAVEESGAPRGDMRFFQVVRLPLTAEEFRDMDREVVGGDPATITDGLIYHVNGPRAGGGWIVADGWTSREARDRFLAERVAPAARRREMSPPQIEGFDVHNTLAPAVTAGAIPISREVILHWLDQQDAAFNRHDAAGVAALYSDDAIVRDQAAGETIRGRSAVEGFIGSYLHAFPDLRWERVGVEIDGNVGVEQWRASGKHDGDLPGLGSTHRQMTIEGCSVLHFGPDGLVHQEENYWDEAAMLRQLGALPEVTAAG